MEADGDTKDVAGDGAETGQGAARASSVPSPEAAVAAFPRHRRSAKGSADPTALRAFRLFEIVRRVAGQPGGGPPVTRGQLAAACRCSGRTIARDIDLLRGERVLDFDDQRRRYYLLERMPPLPGAAPTPPPRLTVADVMALALVRGTLSGTGVPGRDAALTALDKAVAALPPRLAALFAEGGAAVRPAALPRDYSGAPVAALLDAIAAGRTVRIDYHSASSGERAWRRVDPYAVEPRAGVFWELHGWCHKNRTIRTFALDNLFGVEVTDVLFVRREAEWSRFAAESGGAVGGLRGASAPGDGYTVDVVFAPAVARYARRYRWPASLSVRDAPERDGGNDDAPAAAVELTGTVSHVDGMVAELLRWRRHARVRGGPELRARMAEEVRAMAALYAEDTQGAAIPAAAENFEACRRRSDNPVSHPFC